MVLLASGQLSILPPPSKSSDAKIHILCFSSSRVQKECLAFSPRLPNDISELCIRGVNYLGRQMDWLLRKDDVCVILREQASSAGNAYDLQVVLKASGIKIPLTPGNTQTKTCKDSSPFLVYSNKIYLCNEHETLYNNKEECST